MGEFRTPGSEANIHVYIPSQWLRGSREYLVTNKLHTRRQERSRVVEKHQRTLAAVVVIKLRKHHSWRQQVLAQSEACGEGEGHTALHKFSGSQGQSRTEPWSLPK